MLRLLAAVVLFTNLLLPQVATREDLAATLQRHAQAIGAEHLAALGNLRASATLTRDGSAWTVRTLVRRQPFALRQEWQQDGAEAQVGITDGRTAWDGKGLPLRGAPARRVLDAAFLDGLLYLDPAAIRGGLDGKQTWPLRDHDGLLPEGFPTGRSTRCVALGSPSGNLFQLHFDVEDDKLIEVANPDTGGAVSWARYGGHERFGGLLLPTRAAFGVLGQSGVALMHVTSIEVGVALADELFAGCPVAPTPPLQHAGRLQLVAYSQPGSAHVVLPEVLVNGRPVVALLDTGATSSAVTPALAQALALPACASVGVTAFTGAVQLPTAWLDEIASADRRLLQRVAAVTSMPAIYPLPPDRQPGFLFAMESLDDSPVLDIARGELLCRGAPVRPLAELGAGGERVVTLPLARDAEGAPMATIEVNGVRLRAIVDSGSPGTLRLAKAALQRCGLPVDPTTWTVRGATAATSQQAGGARFDELLARLPVFMLGPVRFVEPLVQLSRLTAEVPASDCDAWLGAGAFLAFRRVGFDFARGRLELDPGDAMRAGVDGALEVPPPCVPLGLGVGAASAGAPGGVIGLPVIVIVMPGSPAARAGLRVDELLARIDGRSCATMTGDEVGRALWVGAGKTVELEVIGADGERRVVRLP